MFRQLKLATIIAVAVSAMGITDSAEAHIGLRGGGGGGIRIGGGGGLVPRARQGNANGNRGGNAGTARGVTPAPKAPVAPPVVQKSGSKPPVASSAAKTTSSSIGKAISGSQSGVSQGQSVPAKTPSGPSIAEAAPEIKKPGNVVTTAAEPTKDEPAATEPPAAESAPIIVVSKDVALPQVPVGATITLSGKDLSEKEGQVVLQIGEIALPATIKEWSNSAVVCTLPPLGLTKASKATLHVLKADGKTASTMEVQLVTVLPTTAEATSGGLDSGKFER